MYRRINDPDQYPVTTYVENEVFEGTDIDPDTAPQFMVRILEAVHTYECGDVDIADVGKGVTMEQYGAVALDLLLVLIYQ